MLMLAGCGSSDGALKVAYIDSPDGLFGSGVRLSSGAQHLRAATDAGLVAFDAQGEVVPALADRWIVTDDGRSFIFRLRDRPWPDGTPLTSESVRAALRKALASLRGTSLGEDLAPIADVRAMAGRVVEIRLASPVPTLLQLLAQPELALTHGTKGGGSGQMTLTRRGDLALLRMKPPADRGLPEEADWQAYVRPVEVVAVSAAQAIEMFDADAVDVVLGGRLGSLPLADTGPLSRGTVRLDPALGLFGLQVRRPQGLLAEREGREAVAMAIDRQALIAPFNIGGWVPTTRVVVPGLPANPGTITERWSGEGIDDLRVQAARRVAAWRAAHRGEPAHLTLALDRSPGTDLLFGELVRQLGLVGIELERVPESAVSDLVLVDRVARYAAPRWFLTQFHCSLNRGLCEADVDFLVDQAVGEPDSARRAALFTEAETRLTLSNVFIPFGAPLRWSLVRSNVDGFAANPWAIHPLSAMAIIPR